MKAKIVSSKMLAQTGFRLDASCYMDTPALDEEIQKAEINLKRAKTRLKNAKENKQKELKRIEELRKTGLIKDL
jgi:hypothetical protein